jgi:hypothetical protein
MPLTEVPSHAVRIRFPEPPIEGGGPGGSARPTGAAGGPGGTGEATTPRGRVGSVVALESTLRRAPVPVIARVSQDSLHLDVLALAERDLETVAENVAWAIDQVTGESASPPRAAGYLSGSDFGAESADGRPS